MADYTPDPALVDQLAALVRVRIGWPISHGEAATIVTATLQGLATKGRLLPPETEVRTEWGTRISSTDGWSEDFKCGTREFAQARIDYHARMRAEVPNWKGRAELISRTRAVGPWLPAPTKTEITEETP